MGFSRQEYWSGLPCPPPGDLPDPGTKPTPPAAPALQAVSLPMSHWGNPKNLMSSPQRRLVYSLCVCVSLPASLSCLPVSQYPTL